MVQVIVAVRISQRCEDAPYGAFFLACHEGCSKILEEPKSDTGGALMEINFRHDVDAVLAEAREQRKPVLLDFSAAPM